MPPKDLTAMEYRLKDKYGQGITKYDVLSYVSSVTFSSSATFPLLTFLIP